MAKPIMLNRILDDDSKIECAVNTDLIKWAQLRVGYTSGATTLSMVDGTSVYVMEGLSEVFGKWCAAQS